MPTYMNNPNVSHQRVLMLQQAKRYLLSKGWSGVYITEYMDMLGIHLSTSMVGKAPDGYYHNIVFKHRNRSSNAFPDTPVDIKKWEKVRSLSAAARARGTLKHPVVPSFLVLYSDGKYRLYTEYMDMPLPEGVTERHDRNDPEDVDPTYKVPHGPLFPIY